MQHSDKGRTNSMNVSNMCPHNACPNNPNNMCIDNNECIENPICENIMAVVEIFFGPEGKPRLCTEIPIRLDIAIIAVVLSAIIEEKEKICN